MKRKKSGSTPKEKRINANEMVAVYDELDRLREEFPEAAAEVNPQYGKKNIMERLLSFYLSMQERFHVETQVNRRVYLWLHLLGFVGIHQFYAKHWIKGLLYVAISWTGISFAMTAIDWMAAFPQKPDKNGMIVV